jgi:anti-sigma factor RsiW
MSGCRELRPLLGAYVLGALEAEEAAAVRAHVAACPACAAEHARLAPLPGLLTLAEGARQATADPPSPALEERVLDAVARAAPRPRRRPRPWFARRGARVLVATGLAALVAATAGVALLGRGGDSGYDLRLRAAAAPPGARAHAQLVSVPGGTAVHLWVRGLPHDPAAVYEVHCDSPDWSASAGTFRVDGQGRAAVVLTTAARHGEYDRLRVLRRTEGGGERLVFSAALS